MHVPFLLGRVAGDFAEGIRPRSIPRSVGKGPTTASAGPATRFVGRWNMAKTKVELVADHTRHETLVGEARSACNRQDYEQAIELAMSAWDSIEGMIQYERKYCHRTERLNVESIEFVLRFAPLLFHYESLDRLDALLKSQGWIEENAVAGLAQRLAAAQSLMADAHRLWNYLENRGECRQDRLCSYLSGDKDRWQCIAETWEQMGIIQRVPDGGSYRLSLTLSLDRSTCGKCPSCGTVGKASKARLLKTMTCPECHAEVQFVLLADSEA